MLVGIPKLFCFVEAGLGPRAGIGEVATGHVDVALVGIHVKAADARLKAIALVKAVENAVCLLEISHSLCKLSELFVKAAQGQQAAPACGGEGTVGYDGKLRTSLFDAPQTPKRLAQALAGGQLGLGIAEFGGQRNGAGEGIGSTKIFAAGKQGVAKLLLGAHLGCSIAKLIGEGDNAFTGEDKSTLVGRACLCGSQLLESAKAFG